MCSDVKGKKCLRNETKTNFTSDKEVGLVRFSVVEPDWYGTVVVVVDVQVVVVVRCLLLLVAALIAFVVSSTRLVASDYIGVRATRLGVAAIQSAAVSVVTRILLDR